MGITINISDSATALTSTSNSDAVVMPLDAGASVALAATGEAEPKAHPHTGDQAINGGCLPASLVQEIDAALTIGANTSLVSLSTYDVNAGSAPV